MSILSEEYQQDYAKHYPIDAEHRELVSSDEVKHESDHEQGYKECCNTSQQ